MANAADNFEFDDENVFANWDLNDLAMQVGGGADGVRDRLSDKRSQYLNPLMAQYRGVVGAGNSPDDDYGLWQDEDFRGFVKTGQTSKGYKPDPTPTQQNTQQTATQSWTNNDPPPVQVPTSDKQNELYELLRQRAMQTLNTDPASNPVIRNQVDAYRAEQLRGVRNSLADLAESGSANANFDPEARMLNERAAQATGSMQAGLVGQELQRQREEIAQYTQMLQQQGQFEQAQQFQAVLANLDAQLKSRGLGLQQQGLDQDWKKALLQNEQFLKSLGLQASDRASYWDWLRSGGGR